MAQAADPAPIVAPLPAATVVLMRERPGQPAPELLLLERHADARFGAGAFVFPGGMLEPGDHGAAAQALSPAVTPAKAAERLGDGTAPETALAFHVAALRETFEEALVLLAEPGRGAAHDALPDTAARRAARAAMQAGRLGFLEWLAQRGLALATQRLVYFAHWITPEPLPQRFAARFFLVPVPAGVEAEPDRREVTGQRWLSAREAIALREQGAIHLMDPTVRNLELLAPFASTAEAVRALSGRPVRAIQPKLRMNGDGSRTIVYPWDAAYGTS